MPALAIFLLVTWLLAVMNGHYVSVRGTIDSINSEYRTWVFQRLADAATEYYYDHDAFPPTLAALYADYDWLRGMDTYAGLAYLTAGPITDATANIGFRRAGLVKQRGSVESAASVFAAANNTCPPSSGPQTFDAGLQWCGQPDTEWWVVDERELIFQRQAIQRMQLQRILRRFVLWYDQNGLQFPNPGNAQPQSLAALAGIVINTITVTTPGGSTYSYKTCGSGVGAWSGIPIDCSDVVSLSGAEVTYRYVNARQIEVATVLNIRNATGELVPVAVNVDLN